MKHILSMMPAVGWRAVYWHEAGIAEESPLVAWVLIRNDAVSEYPYVEGLDSRDGAVDFVEGNDRTFLAYAGPDQDLAEWHEEARAHAERARANAQQRKAGPRSS